MKHGDGTVTIIPFLVYSASQLAVQPSTQPTTQPSSRPSGVARQKVGYVFFDLVGYYLLVLCDLMRCDVVCDVM